MIIDTYLTEDADNYITIDNYIVSEIINDYKEKCKKKEKLP